MLSSRRALLSALALAAVALVLLLLRTGAGTGRAEPLAGARPGAEPTAETPQEPLRAPAGPRAPGVGAPDAEAPATAPTLLCLAAEDESPLAGVALYDGDRRVAGPSGEDGRVELPPAHAGRLTAWREGRAPHVVAGAAPPARVLLERADGLLEVRLASLRAGDRVVRTQVQPHVERAAAAGPWSPMLSRRALDLYASGALPAGSYDLYFWIQRPPRGTQPFALRGVELGPGARERVTLDLERDRTTAPPR